MKAQLKRLLYWMLDHSPLVMALFMFGVFLLLGFKFWPSLIGSLIYWGWTDMRDRIERLERANRELQRRFPGHFDGDDK